MSSPNDTRNKAVVLLRKIDKKTFNLPTLSDFFGVSKQTLHIVIKRDWNKYDLPKTDGQ